MRQQKHLIFLGVLLFLLPACKTSNVASEGLFQKRKYRKGWHKSSSNTSFEINQHERDTQNMSTGIFEDDPILVADNSNTLGQEELNLISDETVTSDVIFKTQREENAPPIQEGNDEPCDLIMLKSGEEINAKVTEIGSYEIKYKQCDNQSGPVFTIPKNDVFKIKYANGTSTLISAIESNTSGKLITSNNQGDNSKKLRVMALTGIIIAGLSLFIPLAFGLIFAIGGLALGIAALVLLNKKPKEQRHRGTRNMSLWAIVLGAISILGFILVFVYL